MNLKKVLKSNYVKIYKIYKDLIFYCLIIIFYFLIFLLTFFNQYLFILIQDI
jgi:hypothetical protein